MDFNVLLNHIHICVLKITDERNVSEIHQHQNTESEVLNNVIATERTN